MSDPDSDLGADPIDQAYAQAETLLSDDAARAARRARVLAAVASEPAAQPTAAFSARRSTWRRGGWLAAASVVGLAVFAAVQLYRPALRPPPAAPSPVAVQAPAAPADVAPRGIASSAAADSASAPAEEKATRQIVLPPKIESPIRDVPAASPSNLPALAPPVPPPPPPALAQAPAPRAFPAEAPPQPVVAETRRAAAPAPGYRSPPSDVSGGVAVDEPAQTRPVARDAIGSAFAGPPGAAAMQSKTAAGKSADLAARLRAAAAAGRTSEVATLLDDGAAVDAADASGDTALMKSVRADHPAAAAVLRRHGASLDHKNHAGESARDIATEKSDPDLNQAIGVGP